MRKISTLLTMLFLLCGVCMAQSSRVVYLKTDGRGTNGRYMSCDAAGGVGSVAEKDNSALWILSPVAGKADTYTLRNASNAGYVQAKWVRETQWQTVASLSEASELVMEEMSDGTFAFRKPDAASGSYYYAHLARDMARVVMWSASDGNPASRWQIEDLEGELKATVLSNVEYVGKLQTALANAEMNYANTLPSGFVKTGDALITDVSQLWCNFPQNAADGGVTTNTGVNDGDGLSALLDDDLSTYFHTRWGGLADDDYHFLQVTLPETSELKDFVAEFTTRNLRTIPTKIEVYGATKADGDLVWETSPYTTVSLDENAMTLLTNGAQREASFEAGNGHHNYAALRFRVMTTNTGDASCGHPCFALSTFQLYGAESTVKPKYIAATDEDRMKLYNAIQLANGLDLDVTKDNYKAIYEAIEATVTEVRDGIGGESLDLLLVIDEAKEQLAALTLYEDTPGQLSAAGKEEWEAAIGAAQTVYEAYDKDDQVSRLNCVEAQCQLEKFLASHSKSNVDVPVDALVSGFFTIENPNDKRGAVVYDSSKNDNVDPAHHDNNYVWYADVKDVDATNPNHLWGFFKNEENGEVYLYNVGKKLFANPNGVGTYGDTWIFSKVPSPIKIEALDAPFVRVIGEGKTMSVSTSYVGPVITYYADGDAGVPFQFKRSTATLSEADAAALAALLQEYVDRPKLVRPLRDRIDYLWDLMAFEKEHAGEVGHLNESAIAALDSIVADANEAANIIVITDEYEQSDAVLAVLNAAWAKLNNAAESYVMPESGKYYTIKSDNSSDAHYHLAHFLIQNAANDFLVIPNCKGEFEKSAWRCMENEDGTFSFTHNDRNLAFGVTTPDAYTWTLGAPLRRVDEGREDVQDDFGRLSFYSNAQQEYLAVNTETASVEGFLPVRYYVQNPDVLGGTLYKNYGTANQAENQGWNNTWLSAAEEGEPVIKLSVGLNNMEPVSGVEDAAVGLRPGAGGCVYNVAIVDESGSYQLDGFTMVVAMQASAGKTENTITVNGEEYTIGQDDQTIVVPGSSFTLTGSNGYSVLLKSLKVDSHINYATTPDLSTDYILEAVEVDEAGNIAGGTTVGIDSLFNETAHDVYSLSGVLVRKQATNLNGLAKGVYVVNGQKVLVK